MDYKAKYEELLESWKRHKKELERLRNNNIQGEFCREMTFRVFRNSAYLMAINRADSGQYVDVNDSFLKSLGYTREEVVGKTPDELKIFPDFDEIGKYYKLISRLEKVKDYKVILRTSGGEERKFLLSAELVPMDDESYVLTTFREIEVKNGNGNATNVLEEVFDTVSHYLSLYSIGDDKKFYVSYLNNTVEQVEFIRKGDIIGKCINDTPLGGRIKLIELLEHIRITGDIYKLSASLSGDDTEGFYMGFPLSSGSIAVTWEPGILQKNLDDLYKQDRIFQKFAEIFPEMIYEVDLTGKIVYGNKRGLDFFGFSLDDMKAGLYISDLFPDTYTRMIENLKKLNQPGETASNEYYGRKKDGTMVPVVTHSYPIFHDDKIISYRGVLTDISRQKEYESQIEREKAFLEHIYNSTPAAIAITNRYGIVSMINREFTTLFGYLPEEAVNHNINDLIVPDALRSEAEMIDNLAQMNRKETRDTIRRDKYGKKINVSLVASSIVINNVTVAHLGIYRDITAERKTQVLQEILYNISTAALNQYGIQEIYPIIVKELSKIWDTNNFFIALYDKNTDMLTLPFFSDEKDSFFEVPSKKTITGLVIKRNKSVLLREADLKILEEAGEIELVGTPCKVWMGVPLRVENNTLGVMCLQDYNDENKFSQDDLYLMEFIATQIATTLQRRMMLDNLIHARQKAEEAAQSKQQFMSTMSHEIRTPLNEVIGITNLLLQGNPREDQMDYINTLKFSGNHLLTLVNDVLDYNKMESGKIIFEQTQFNLGNFLGEIMRTYSFRSQTKNLDFRIRKDGNLPQEVIGDPVRLNQILSNLLSNALKFTNEGSITIKIRELERKDRKSKIEFAVEDTGIGISKEKHSLIFDSFIQASADTTRHFGGTGLGLAICKKLVELQGGKLTLESEPGKGSTFRFDITLGIPEKSSTPDNPDILETYTGLEGKRILVAEDNKINFFVANKFLTNWGLIVTHAENGQIALDLLEKGTFDLILMDLHMPVLDGIEATRIIRNSADEKISSIPIVALTAAIMSESHDKIENLKINDYVLKPFKPHDLFDRIKKHIR